MDRYIEEWIDIYRGMDRYIDEWIDIIMDKYIYNIYIYIIIYIYINDTHIPLVLFVVERVVC